MASMHRQPGRPFWYCSFRGADGKWKFKSTKTRSRREAEIIGQIWTKAAHKARSHSLTPERARKIIEDGVVDLLESSGQTAPQATVREFFNSWLKEKESGGDEMTALRYRTVMNQFLEYLGTKANATLANLNKEDIAGFRDALLDKVAASTVNTNLKILRAALNRAVKNEYLQKNPALLVDTIRRPDKQERRAFSLIELKKLLEIATGDWKTAVLMGLYTGLRLQDVVNLTWNNLDMQHSELTVVTRKTGRTQILPLAKPLVQHLLTLPAGDSPDDSLCPSLADKPSGNLSQQFYTNLQTAGLVVKRNHHAKSGHKPVKRKVQPLSFHCLRHTATSLLKNAGISDSITMDIIGHETEAVSRNYTHIDMETKRKAIDTMPDVLPSQAEPKPKPPVE